MHFLFPWGLASLASLGGIVFLYFYVFRGKRIPVSALFLWEAGRSLRLEGEKRRRPPVTWPLVFELLAALLLSLAVGALVLSRPTTRRHVAVVLDSSASMNAMQGAESFRERARKKVLELCGLLGPDARVTLVTSGSSGQVLGSRPVTAAEADALLAGWRPCDPPHALDPAIEVARSLTDPGHKVVLITDRKFEHGDVIPVGVGSALENTAWVAAHWMSGSKLFALVKHFGAGKPEKVVVVSGDGKELARLNVRFAERDSAPLVIDVPEGVSNVVAELPPDALENDNTLRAARPSQLLIPVQVNVDRPVVQRHLSAALAATGRTRESGAGPCALSFSRLAPGAEPPPASSASFEVLFHMGDPKSSKAYVGPFFVSGLHPLLRGIDLHGAIWSADPEFRAGDAEPLVSVGDVPLIALEEHRLVINLVPERSNLFQQAAWPVLISNIVEHVHGRSPGLRRFSYRLGESLAFVRPPEWKGRIEVRAPSGARTAFDGSHVYYGRFEIEGVYEIFASGKRVAAVDVNLFAEEESDLIGALSYGDLGRAKPVLVPEVRARSFHGELALAAAALLLTCWAVLERRSA